MLALAGAQTKIIPGHGPLASRADQQATRDMLAAVVKFTQELRRQGRSDAELRAAKPAAEFDAKWGGGFNRSEPFVQIMPDATGR